MPNVPRSHESRLSMSTTNRAPSRSMPLSGEELPDAYDREPTYPQMLEERDVYVPMRDGVGSARTSTGRTRPSPSRRCSPSRSTTRRSRGPTSRRRCRRNPRGRRCGRARSRRATPASSSPAAMRTSSAMPRGFGKSEGGGARTWDSLRPHRVDRGAAVVRRQRRHDRHLRLRCRAGPCRRGSSRRRSRRSSRSTRVAPTARSAASARSIPGGVLHTFRYLVGHFGVIHEHRGAPGELPPEREDAVAGGASPIRTTGCTRTSTTSSR